MRVQAQTNQLAVSRPQTKQVKEQPAPESHSSERFEFSHVDVKSGLLFGALGLVPVVGAISNFGAGAESGFNDNPLGAKAGGIGFLANIAGTASLAGGLLTGNDTAKTIGYSLLGVSGLTAAYAGFF